ARETFGKVALEVRDLEIVQPLVFDRVGSFEVMTRLSHDTHVLEIKSRPVAGAGDEWLINVQTTVAQAPSAQGKSEAPLKKVREVFDSERVYELSRQRGFSYGDAFRRIASVEVYDDRTARALLTPPPSDSEHFILDPRVLDAAFHTFFALPDEELAPDALLLPVRFSSIRVFQAGAAVAQVIAHVTSSTSRSRVADFTLLDAAGHVVALMSQARCRIVPRTTRETLDNLVYRT